MLIFTFIALIKKTFVFVTNYKVNVLSKTKYIIENFFMWYNEILTKLINQINYP